MQNKFSMPLESQAPNDHPFERVALNFSSSFLLPESSFRSIDCFLLSKSCVFTKNFESWAQQFRGKALAALTLQLPRKSTILLLITSQSKIGGLKICLKLRWQNGRNNRPRAPHIACAVMLRARSSNIKGAPLAHPQLTALRTCSEQFDHSYSFFLLRN